MLANFYVFQVSLKNNNNKSSLITFSSAHRVTTVGLFCVPDFVGYFYMSSQLAIVNTVFNSVQNSMCK